MYGMSFHSHCIPFQPQLSQNTINTQAAAHLHNKWTMCQGHITQLKVNSKRKSNKMKKKYRSSSSHKVGQTDLSIKGK